MTKQQQLLFGIVGIVVIGGLIWWGQARNANNIDGEVINIGVVASMTGSGSFYGQNIRKGVELAVREINEDGGVAGRPLHVVYEDDATNPKQTVSASQKLITTDGVNAIIGVQWDFLANAVIPLANESGVVVISTAAPFDSLLSEHQQGAYFYTTFPSASAAEKAVQQFLTREKANTAVILAVNNGWGEAHVKAYESAARAVGVDVLDTLRLAKTEGNDLRAELSRIQQMNPDAILLSTNDADNITFLKRYREFGLDIPVLSHENISDPLYTGRASLSDAEGLYFFEFPDPTKTFVERYRDFHGEEPQISADTAYDAVYALKRAIELGGATREGIADGMKKVDFSGASGPIDFTRSNYPQEKEAILRQVVNGEIVSYDPAN